MDTSADAKPPEGSRATSNDMGGFMDRLMQPQVLQAVQQLKPLAQQANMTLGQFSLAWILDQPNVASAIVGASWPEQVEENAAASGATVDTALFEEAERIIEAAHGVRV